MPVSRDGPFGLGARNLSHPDSLRMLQLTLTRNIFFPIHNDVFGDTHLLPNHVGRSSSSLNLNHNPNPACPAVIGAAAAS